MIKTFQRLCSTLEKLDSMNDDTNENIDLIEFRESIDKNLVKNYNILISGMLLFNELTSLSTKEDKEKYQEAYDKVMDALKFFLDYLEDVHRILFWINKKKRLLAGEITEEEYNESDIIYLEDD